MCNVYIHVFPADESYNKLEAAVQGSLACVASLYQLTYMSSLNGFPGNLIVATTCVSWRATLCHVLPVHSSPRE